METLAAFLASQPLLALFLVIGLGYALGEVSLGGLSLGVGAVLFVGLALGALVPGAAPPPLLGLLGLVMFLYGIGIQYGRQFVAGLTGRPAAEPTCWLSWASPVSPQHWPPSSAVSRSPTSPASSPAP